MLVHEYSTRQDKIEMNLEVIGGAGVRRKIDSFFVGFAVDEDFSV
jgi:hypothetical protein